MPFLGKKGLTIVKFFIYMAPRPGLDLGPVFVASISRCIADPISI
jgi:hypothetical protein